MGMKQIGFAIHYISSTISQKILTPETRPKKYAGKIKLSLQEGNDFIAKALEGSRPFMVGRYGSVELATMKYRFAQRYHLVKEIPESQRYVMCNNAGFFPCDEEKIEKFADLIIEKSSLVDLLGVFYWIMEDFVIKNCAPQTMLVRGRGIEPWYVERPWSAVLKDKKVLVIHPFEDTIRSQFHKREQLFPGKNILPKFELQTIKAVQTIAGEKDERFADWFEALEYMYTESLKKDFDVAIIGCGAYGFPLAAMLKEAGKSAIHLGGATQYLFGIRSKRGDNHPIIGKLYNDAWVRASAEETPKNAKNVEDGCYW